jgi:SPP1 gp7 family putative phage head morphogenesis protein
MPIPDDLEFEDEVQKKLDDLMRGLYSSQVRSLAATITTQVANETRQEVYKDNDIPRVVWEATLDSSVCEDCEALNGTSWPVDEAEIPPEHWNCRCVLVPVDE